MAIYEEFLDAMQDKNGLHKIRLVNTINRLKFDLKLIELCIHRLSIGYKEETFQTLRKHIRVDGKMNPEDQDSYFRTLSIVTNRTGNIKGKIFDLEAELAVIEKAEPVNGKGATEKQFDSLIAQVSLFAKFHINKQVMFTGEFIELYRAMRRTAEEMEAVHKRATAKTK